MALVIEDGTIIAGANSYQTLVEIRAFCLARGVTLSAVDSVVEAFSIKAMDWLESKRLKYQGAKTDAENQELQWPRQYVYIDGYLFDSNTIPKELKAAQNQLILEQHNGVNILPTRQSGGFIVREKTGPMDTTYSEAIGAGLSPDMTAVDSLLEVLYKASSNFNGTGVHT